MTCTECRNPIYYKDKYTLATDTHDIICDACRESYALEHMTLSVLQEYLGVDDFVANSAGGKALLDVVLAAGLLRDFVDYFYEGAYAVEINNEPDASLMRQWEKENAARDREFERMAI